MAIGSIQNPLFGGGVEITTGVDMADVTGMGVDVMVVAIGMVVTVEDTAADTAAAVIVTKTFS
jgi:hypothetical protein